MNPIVTQFGFSTGSGSLANIGDGQLGTSWSPLATRFETYTAQFFADGGGGAIGGRLPNVGASFPHLQFDLGEPKRVPKLTMVTGSFLAFGPALVVGSDNPSTSVATALQSGDILLGNFTAAQMNSGIALDLQPMKDADIRKRYIRILQRSSIVAVAPPPFPANTFWYDSGSGNFTVPDYTTTFNIELWGAAASGGSSSVAIDGGDTIVSIADASMPPGYLGFTLTAGGGHKATTNFANAPNAALGGTASGGNTLNLQGGPGGSPSNFNGNQGLGGAGGDSPFGGTGALGARLEVSQWDSGALFFTGSRFGIDGNAPGGGGSGANIFVPVSAGSFFKYPGGAGGGYVKHVLTRGAGGPVPGALIAFLVGIGGASNAVGGRGANGRAKFSWV